MRYQIVTNDATKSVMVDDIRVWADENGYECKGVLFPNDHLRPEIRECPTFKGLCGPCYGGHGIVRYEDWGSYKRLSV